MDHPPPFNPLTATASELKQLLADGRVTGVRIVQEYLAQIEKHNSGLHLNAIISVIPDDIDLGIARNLDAERQGGKLRSALHDIPIVLKDTFLTPPELGMPTTVGAIAFEGAYAKRADEVVSRLIGCGMIILGKANMTEFCGVKDDPTTAGCSALGGQTQSACILCGKRADDLWLGRSTPGGSSSGSAVAVSAGFAPLALGTETSGSVCMPANRAGLWYLKATHGRIPKDGVFRLSRDFDGIGGMAKSTEDSNLLMSILMVPETSITADSRWTDVTVGFVDPDERLTVLPYFKWDDDVEKQIVSGPTIVSSQTKNFKRNDYEWRNHRFEVVAAGWHIL